MTSQPIPATVTEVRLAAHLTDKLTMDNFDVVEVPLRRPDDGEIVVRHEYLQFGAVMADLMREGADIPGMPASQLGRPVTGVGVGVVVASNSPDVSVGTTVLTTQWAQYSVGPAQQYLPLDRSVVPDPSFFLNQGPTAYYGMVDIAGVGPGDVVYVSGAAGAVGSLAGQIAKLRGAARVIGSAGSPSKVDYLVNVLGYDAAFDYNDRPVVDRLRELAPDGITVFFDCVGGEQFEAAIEVAAPFARFALCGALAGQLGDAAGGFPKLDLMRAITKHLTLRPFACFHTAEQVMAWNMAFGQWLGEGRFVYPMTVLDATIAEAPHELLGYLAGKHTGAVVVKYPA